MASKWKCTKCGNFDFVTNGVCDDCTQNAADEAAAEECYAALLAMTPEDQAAIQTTDQF